MLFSLALVASVAALDATAAVAHSATASAAAAPYPPPARPLQKKLLDWDMTAFVHFSVTTFSGDQGGSQDPAKFAPPDATTNVSQWVATVKAMGAKVAVLTSKHEAGFCLWPTKTSSLNFSIAMSPTVGHRDLIREFTDACKAQDMLAGLYFGAPDAYTVAVLKHPQGSPAHLAVQLAQMEELTTNYGPLSYVWFDHYSLRTSNPDPTCVKNSCTGRPPACVKGCPARCFKGGSHQCGYQTPVRAAPALLLMPARSTLTPPDL